MVVSPRCLERPRRLRHTITVRDDHLPAKSSASRLSGRCYIGGARYTIYESSSAIQRVIDRYAGDQPRAAAASPRTRLLEPSENTAMLRPHAAMASSADQDCAAPRPSLVAMALAISPRASSPLSTNMKVRAGAFASAVSAKKLIEKARFRNWLRALKKTWAGSSGSAKQK